MSEFSLTELKYHDVYPFISVEGNQSEAAKGRSVLVAGAGSGIGTVTALIFAQAGASTIVLTGRRQIKLDEVASSITSSYTNCRVEAISSDISEAASVDSLFETIKEKGISLDVLVNSAGIYLDRNPIRNSTPSQWWMNWQVMILGPYLTIRAFLRQLPEPSKSSPPAVGTYSVVNISSIGSNFVLPNGSSYAISKTALNRLTEFTAAENRLWGVQAAAFHPGGVADTDLTSSSPEWMRSSLTDTPALSAGTALYLSTPRAAYLSGRYVDARWDLEELETKHKEQIIEENLLKTASLGEKRVPIPDVLKKVIEGQG